MKNQLVLLSLNEINFELIKEYLEDSNLNNFKFLSGKIKLTEANEKYSHLEPWIQWPSIYTGKSADQHKMFRLGDAVKFDYQTIFNDIENLGIKVGAISPMNLKNNLKKPCYFIPDPWTETPSDDNFLSKIISKTLSYFVKENSNLNLNLKYYFFLILIFIKFSRLKNYFIYFKLFFTSFNCKWRKALFLDLLINDIHVKYFKLKKPSFSNIFLNGFAHIQHHYMFNSKIKNKKQINPYWYVNSKLDPIKEALYVYNNILGDYLDDNNKVSVVIATGLSQVPYDRTKFYYRLKSHKSFFKNFNIKFHSIQELMSRDFIINFIDKIEAENAYKVISNIKDENNRNIFGDLELNEKSIFTSFIYDEEIKDQKLNSDKEISLKDYVNFVAIKNGMHSSKGYIYSDLPLINTNEVNINEIKKIIYNFFSKENFAK